MNFLILVNSAVNYKYFFTNIAKTLERKGHRTFFAFNSHLSTILEPLEAIDNNSNTFFFDDYFKENYNSFNNDNILFSSTWGDSFFSEFDRFMTHDYNLNRPDEYWEKVKICLDNFFDILIDENDIDIILFENISNSFSYSAYRNADKKNKIYLGLAPSRIPGRHEIQTSIVDQELQALQKHKQLPISNDELIWFKKYQNDIIETEPDYMKSNGLDNVSISKFLNLRITNKVKNLITATFKTEHYFDYQVGNPLSYIRRSVTLNIKRNIFFYRSKKFYLKDAIVKKHSCNDTFYVYPMHYHPESSTSVLAPSFTSELNNIINISNNLPFGTYLYVKDHKSAIGVQSPDFYKKINALPAVKLVSPNFNIKNLILRSKGVITVNSTAGYEALIIGKPVLLLGSVFYENFSNVTKLTSFKEITTHATSKTKQASQEDVLKDIISYKRYTFEGTLNINKYKKLNAEDYECIAKNILAKIIDIRSNV